MVGEALFAGLVQVRAAADAIAERAADMEVVVAVAVSVRPIQLYSRRSGAQ